MSFGCNESFVCVVVCPSYCLTRHESFGQIGYPLEGFGSFVCFMDCLSHCLTDRLKRQCLFGRDSFKRSNRSSVARSDYRIGPSSVAVLNRLSRHFFIEGHLKEPNRPSVLFRPRGARIQIGVDQSARKQTPRRLIYYLTPTNSPKRSKKCEKPSPAGIEPGSHGPKPSVQTNWARLLSAGRGMCKIERNTARPR